MNFAPQFSKIEKSVIRVLAFDITNQPHVLKSTGSGVLFGDGTHALTCNHCIVTNTIIVGAHSGSEEGKIGTVIFQDVNLDIAIIKFQDCLGPGVTIKNSNTVLVGNEAFVVGFPMSSNTITALSAHIAGFENINTTDHIKIDAAINHGNSGGPLFNENGELIGIINTKKGNLSDFLNTIESTPEGGVMMSINGINPIQIIKQLIREMKQNLNLGIGTAIPTEKIASLSPLINDLLV